MKTEKILSQLKKVSEESFVAAGKFAPRGVIAGQVLGGIAGGAAATAIAKRKAKKDGGVELPRVFYVAVGDEDVVLFKGKMGLTVTPSDELYRWSRKAVRVEKAGGLRNLQVDFTADGSSFGALYGRGDSSAEHVVKLLSA